LTRSKQNTKPRKKGKGEKSTGGGTDKMPVPRLTVVMTEVAAEDYGKLEKDDRRKLDDYVKRLHQLPNPTAGSERLKHFTVPVWRKKLGRLRVIYTFAVQTKELEIVMLDLRDSETYAELKKRLGL